MHLKLWSNNTTQTFLRCCVSVLLTHAAARGKAIDLLERYPTKLTAGDESGERARQWEFTAADVFQVSRFSLAVGTSLNPLSRIGGYGQA